MGEPNVETVLLGNERDPSHLPRRLQIQQFREDIDIAHGTDPPLCPFVHRIYPQKSAKGHKLKLRSDPKAPQVRLDLKKPRTGAGPDDGRIGGFVQAPTVRALDASVP